MLWVNFLKFCLTRKRVKGKIPLSSVSWNHFVIQLFWIIWIFAPIQQEAKHDQEKLSAEQKWKSCWQSPAMFCLFTDQAKIQICCTVKLIPWNVVNLSHLYFLQTYLAYFFHKRQLKQSWFTVSEENWWKHDS